MTTELLPAFLFSILTWCHPSSFFENFRKMTLAGKPKISGNDRCGSVCISEEALAFFYFFVAYKGSQRNACFLRKFAGQVLTTQEQMVSDLLGCDCF